MEVLVKGTLLVGFVIDGKRYTEVTLTNLTVGAMLTAHSNATAGDFLGIHELSSMTTIDALGRSPTYAEITHASGQDLEVLNSLRADTEKKELDVALAVSTPTVTNDQPVEIATREAKGKKAMS